MSTATNQSQFAEMQRQDTKLRQAMRNAKNLDVAKVEKLSEEFESIFLGIVLKSMRKAVPESKLIHGGNAEDIYRSLLDMEYAKQMAAQRHTGIADAIQKFLFEGMGNPQESRVKQAGIAAYDQQVLQTKLRGVEKQGKIDHIPASLPVDSASR